MRLPIRVCASKAKHCAEQLGEHSHWVYLGTCALVDGHILLRAISGGCLVFCVLSRVLKDEEAI